MCVFFFTICVCIVYKYTLYVYLYRKQTHTHIYIHKDIHIHIDTRLVSWSKYREMYGVGQSRTGTAKEVKISCPSQSDG